MARYKNINPVTSESDIMRGLILDSRDLFSKERYEERIDYELAVLTQEFKKNGMVDAKQVRKIVEKFIRVVERILKELEDQKRKGEQEEYKKINEIRKFLIEGTKINSGKLKNELEKFGKTLKSNTLSGLKSYRRREKRLRRGKGPLGYTLKKLRSDTYLDAEVAKKAYNIKETAQKENKLMVEVDFLIFELNQNPNDAYLEGLKSRITSLVRDYEKDFENFLNIEIDREIEEARKLHRIDHYLNFLKMIKRIGNFDDLVEKLNALRKSADNWIYQDSIDATKLMRYATQSLSYGINLLKTSEASKEKDFPGIDVRPMHLINLRVPGVLIHKEGMIDRMGMSHTNRGIVIMHGVGTVKETFITLGKRLATQNYIVYSIDMTSHGENRENFNLGRNSEYIRAAVGWLRHIGIKNVGVIGHSAGASSTLFAICGYNTVVENSFYNQATRVGEILNEITSLIDEKLKSKINAEKIFADPLVVRKLYEFNEEYTKLKKIILDALKNMFEGRSKIDAAVLLSTPATFQSVLKLKGIQFVTKRSKRSLRFLTEAINVGFRLYSFATSGQKSIVYKNVAGKDQKQIMGLIISDFDYLIDYATNIKNPHDFIDWINILCEKKNRPDKTSQFFQYYREFIRRTPKLFIFSLKDQFLKPFQDSNMRELEDHYKEMGETEIVRYTNAWHSLNREGMEFEFGRAKLPKMTYKIVTFLNKYLGAGRLV